MACSLLLLLVGLRLFSIAFLVPARRQLVAAVAQCGRLTREVAL
jgi:hypothetical protein